MTALNIVQQCQAALAADYGMRLRGIVLYGSVARNQATATSDIDLLVLLNTPFDYFEELRRIVDLLYPIQLESEYLISAKPTLLEDFEKGRLRLYRAAQREGVRW